MWHDFTGRWHVTMRRRMLRFRSLRGLWKLAALHLCWTSTAARSQFVAAACWCPEERMPNRRGRIWSVPVLKLQAISFCILLAKDNGWLAAYFDALSRVSQTQQAHLTEPARLKHVYEAFRSPDAEPRRRPAFFARRRDCSCCLPASNGMQTASRTFLADSTVWKDILNEKSDSKLVERLGQARAWMEQSRTSCLRRWPRCRGWIPTRGLCRAI